MSEHKRIIIIAERCSDPFVFMGWHLYAREKTDGSRNTNGGWGWLPRGECDSVAIPRICAELGYGGIPESDRYSEEQARVFHELYPRGRVTSAANEEEENARWEALEQEAARKGDRS
jgi:hypothetical protein